MAETHLSNSKIATYAEFWPHYLREHSKPETRSIHFVGTGLALGLLLAWAATGIGWFGLLALVGGYAPAWIATSSSKRTGLRLSPIRSGH